MGFSHSARSSSVRSVRRWIRILRSRSLFVNPTLPDPFPSQPGYPAAVEVSASGLLPGLGVTTLCEAFQLTASSKFRLVS